MSWSYFTNCGFTARTNGEGTWETLNDDNTWKPAKDPSIARVATQDGVEISEEQVKKVQRIQRVTFKVTTPMPTASAETASWKPTPSRSFSTVNPGRKWFKVFFG